METFEIFTVLCPKHSDGKTSFNCPLIPETIFGEEDLLIMKHTNIFRMPIFSCTNNVVNIIIFMQKLAIILISLVHNMVLMNHFV